MRRKISVGFMLLAALFMSGCSKSDDSYTTALKLMKEGNYQEAENYYSEAAATHNAEAAFYVAMGKNYIELQKYSTASECFEQAISLGDELEEAYKGLGIAHYEQGQYVEAISDFNKSIEQVDLSVGGLEYDTLEYRGACERKLNKLGDALKTYDALIKLGVNKTRQYMYEGQIYLALNETQKAGECFDAVLDIKDDEVELYFSIYQSYIDANFKDEGMKYLSRALLVEGNSAEAHLWRGKIYYIMGNYSSALTELAFPLEKQNHEAAQYTAFCYESLGDYAKAEELYVDELSRVDDPQMTNYLAMCLSEQGKYSEAWNRVRTAIEQFPDCDCIQELLWNRIVLYEKMGYYPSAYTYMLEYQKLYPQDPLITEELSFLLMKQI